MIKLRSGVKIRSGIKLKNSLGGNVDIYGELPATFSSPAGYENTGTKRINFSEPVTLTITGDVTLSIDGTPYHSGATIPKASSAYHELIINNPGADAGTITFGKRKQITYLYLDSMGSSAITGDITGMKLTVLYLRLLGSSVITGDITGMKLTSLTLWNANSSVITGDITGMKLRTLIFINIGSPVITGDITGMKLTNLALWGIGSSVITGDIAGMELTTMRLRDLGSSLTYGTNPLYITNVNGIQLAGDTVFATAAEYEQLIHDAATGTWSGAHPFVITAGTKANCPDWDTVKADVAMLLTKAAWTIIPSAWLTTGGGSWPLNWKEYTEGE